MRGQLQNNTVNGAVSITVSRVIKILNKNRHRICFTIYSQHQAKSWVNANKAKKISVTAQLSFIYIYIYIYIHIYVYYIYIIHIYIYIYPHTRVSSFTGLISVAWVGLHIYIYIYICKVQHIQLFTRFSSNKKNQFR